MGMHLVCNQTIVIDENTVAADLIVELPKFDLSRADLLRVEAVLDDDADSDGSDTLNIYLQNRWQGNVWNDRVALGQLTGAMSAGEVRDGTLSKFGTLSDTEEAGEPSGSTGASHLTAGTVRNGPFPGRYINKGVGLETAWRILFVPSFTGAGAFPVTVNVYADSVD